MDPRASRPLGTPADAVSRTRTAASAGVARTLLGEETGPLGPPSNIKFIRVKVHRARNLHFGPVERKTPQVYVIFNGIRRSTPKGRGYGENPVFDWSTEFRHTGQETHVVFELRCGGHELGQAHVPMTQVRQAGSLSRALPLMRNGIIADLDGEAAQRLELIVTIECETAARVVRADLQPRLTMARKACKQLRVSIRSIEIKMKDHSEVEPSIINPCVHVSLGCPQNAVTPVAFVPHQSEAEEFVFSHPNRMFDCGGLMRGRNEYYEQPSVPPAPGSHALRGYRKVVGDNLKVTYRDMKYVFWFTEQEHIEFKVVDDHVLSADDDMAIAKIEIDEALELAYEGQGDLPGVARTGPVRKTLIPLDMKLKQSNQEIHEVGEVEFEVEFFQDPVGAPSGFEPLFRRLGKMRRESQDQHFVALSAVEEVVSANTTDNLMQSVPMHLRTAFLDVVLGAMIANIREVVRHEEDGVFCQERVGKACQELGLIYQLSAPAIREYDTLGRSATPVLSLARQADLYNEKCAMMSMHPLIPPLALITEFMRQRGGYAATVRCAIKDGLAAIGKDQFDGKRVFGFLERFVVKTLPGVTLSGFPRLSNTCLNSEEILQQSREPTEADLQATPEELEASIREAKEELGKFMPTIDPSRLMDAAQHPGDVLIVSKDSKRTLLAGSAAMGFFAGLAGGFGVQETAKLIHGIDDQFFCNPKYQTGIGINKYICKFLKESPADEVVANFLGTRKGFICFFWIYFVLFTWGTYSRLVQRFSRLHELALEPMNAVRSPHAMICVSGFLMTRTDVYTPWHVSDKYPWTDAQVYAVRFETDALLQMGDAFNSAMAKLAKQTADAVNLGISFTNPVSLSQQVINRISLEIGDIFDLVYRRAWEAGKYLCNALLATALSQVDENYDAENSDEEGSPEIIRPVRTVSLCGYSMGCIVIQSCLTELQKIADSMDSRAQIAADLVCDVVLVGAPIVGTTDDLIALRHLVSGRFVNGYVGGDKDLIGRQIRRGFRLFAGCNSYSTVPGIENIPLDEFIHIHAHYYMQMPAILMKIFHGAN